MTITIRPYHPNDFDELVALFKQAVQAINIQHYSQEQVTEWTNLDPFNSCLNWVFVGIIGYNWVFVGIIGYEIGYCI